MSRVIVVGAGVAGLASALRILKAAKDRQNISLTVLEAAEDVGGNIRTFRSDGFANDGFSDEGFTKGFTVEAGPNGFLDNVPETLSLVEELGLTDRLLPASESAARRFLYRKGSLHELPSSPQGFFASSVLSWPGKLRALCEPFMGKPKRDDESVYDFAARRIGREAAEILVGAMVAGIYAGDMRKLELKSTFPKMRAMEENYGGLVRAMLAKKRAAKKSGGTDSDGGPASPGGHLTSFIDGFDTLINSLAEAVGAENIRTGTAVTQVVKDEAIFRVVTDDGEFQEAEAVVIAVPAWRAAEITQLMDSEMSDTLAEIPGCSMSVVATGYDAEEVDADVDGFGFLVPRGQGVRILGCLWTSSIYPPRAPAGKVLLRSMIGGAHDSQAISLSDDELLEVVKTDLKKTMGLSASPTFVKIFRYAKGIPQYVQGHSERLARINIRLADLHGLVLTGNSYDGIAVNNCIVDSHRVAGKVMAHLEQSS